MIVNVPTPDEEGLKVPAAPEVIPVPVHVPPPVVAVKLKGAAARQTGLTGVIVASGTGLAVIVT